MYKRQVLLPVHRPEGVFLAAPVGEFKEGRFLLQMGADFGEALLRIGEKTEDRTEVGPAAAQQLQAVLFRRGQGILVGQDHLAGVRFQLQGGNQPGPVKSTALESKGLPVKVKRATPFRKEHFFLEPGLKICSGPGVTAVSYTHLDVYKRQGEGLGNLSRAAAGSRPRKIDLDR